MTPSYNLFVIMLFYMTYLFDYMYICTAFIYTIIMTISTSSDVLCMDLWKMNKRKGLKELVSAYTWTVTEEACLNLYYKHGYIFTDFCNRICKQMPPVV
jgi:hypothetical protein